MKRALPLPPVRVVGRNGGPLSPDALATWRAWTIQAWADGLLAAARDAGEELVPMGATGQPA